MVSQTPLDRKSTSLFSHYLYEGNINLIELPMPFSPSQTFNKAYYTFEIRNSSLLVWPRKAFLFENDFESDSLWWEKRRNWQEQIMNSFTPDSKKCFSNCHGSIFQFCLLTKQLILPFSSFQVSELIIL